jgi:hypothetical protein
VRKTTLYDVRALYFRTASLQVPATSGGRIGKQVQVLRGCAAVTGDDVLTMPLQQRAVGRRALRMTPEPEDLPAMLISTPVQRCANSAMRDALAGHAPPGFLSQR